MSGPPPKRSDERRRRNKPASGAEIIKAPTGKAVPVPKCDGSWHPIAKNWFRSLSKSGQNQFFEPSDWAQARYVAELMTRHLEADKSDGQLFKAIQSAMGDLLTSEGARRRVRIELERTPTTQKASVSLMSKYRENISPHD